MFNLTWHTAWVWNWVTPSAFSAFLSFAFFAALLLGLLTFFALFAICAYLGLSHLLGLTSFPEDNATNFRI